MARAAAATVTPIKKARTIGQLIDELADCEAARTAHAVTGKALDAEKSALQKEIFKTLDEQDTLSGSSKTRRVNITESEVPVTVDWEAGLEWMAKNKCLHLVQRRIGEPAWREIRALPKHRKNLIKSIVEIDGKKVERYDIPGFDTFVKRNLSFTAISPK